jgi:hypothetical protein
MSWIRKDISFGIPHKNLILPIRSAVQAGVDFYERYRNANQDDMEEISGLVKDLILKFRPELKDGLIVLGISMPSFGRWSFWCMHPSFPRISEGGFCGDEMLETCPRCSKPLETCWISHDPVSGTQTMYCSEECAKPKFFL